ncbi:hypothetical protein RJD39_14835 [Vibrio scophthalmi]|uniref:hypothetical protein n=1 Tax=Vibrio scophthalmi TaxID=45658 RepID=UPI00387319F9
MPRGQSSKEKLNSKAYRSRVKFFIPQKILYSVNSDHTYTAKFVPYEYYDSFGLEDTNYTKQEGFVKDFPIIYQGDQNPWDLGNSYLIYRYHSAASSHDFPSIASIERIAIHLLAFRRWIEHTASEDTKKNEKRTEGNQILPMHELLLPDDKSRRVTYRYQRYLKKSLNKEISRSNAKQRINAVVGFYRWIKINNVGHLQNSAFQEQDHSIQISNNIGLNRIISVVSTDLSKDFLGRDSNPPEGIMDGRVLHPISITDQKRLHSLLEMESLIHPQFVLMTKFALFTGARVQTVGTLRIKEIRDLEAVAKSNPNKNVGLPIGFGTRIDMKYGQKNQNRMLLTIPSNVVLDLINFINSEYSINRRLQPESYYGDTDDNYIFLANNGAPYITSKREILDRKNKIHSQRVSVIERVDFKVRKAEGIKNWISNVNKLLLNKHPDFQRFAFHDLRATYGLNYVDHEVAKGTSWLTIKENLMGLMGHTSIETSKTYIDYRASIKEREALSDIHANDLCSIPLEIGR